MKRIAFWDNYLGERGTSVALFDYAFFNQRILKNKSIIIYNKSIESCDDVVKKFEKEFDVYGVNDFSEVDCILESNEIDIFYIIKSGENDGKISRISKTVVHCVFNCFQPHGDVYAPISKWVKGNNGRFMDVPHMINLPNHNRNMRSELSIPDDAIVFGRHGGYEQFDIPYVQKTVYDVAKTNPGIYFLFVNTRSFCDHLPNIIHLDTIVDLHDKVKFINTCDAMLWGRSDGETFGLSIGEFSSKNKPVICTQTGDRTYVEILRDKAIWYDETNLSSVLKNFTKSTDGNWDAYSEFTPENVMKRFKNVFIDCFDISLNILHWKSVSTLKNTLESYKNIDYFGYSKTIFLQAPSDCDYEIIKTHKIDNIIYSPVNIGLVGGLKELIKSAKTKYIIFCENDFQLVHDGNQTNRVLTDCVNLLENNIADVIRLRDNINPGYPLYSRTSKDNLTRDFPYKLECIHFLTEPLNDIFPDTFDIYNFNFKWYVCDSTHQKWSNNVFISSRKWLTDNVLPILEMSTDFMAEESLINNLKHYRVAGGMGLFTHNRLD